jgi:hypothetical protein
MPYSIYLRLSASKSAKICGKYFGTLNRFGVQEVFPQIFADLDADFRRFICAIQNEIQSWQ